MQNKFIQKCLFGHIRIFDTANSYNEEEREVIKSTSTRLSEDRRWKRPGPSSDPIEIKFEDVTQQRPDQQDCGPLAISTISQLAAQPDLDAVKLSTSEGAIERLRMRQAFDLIRNNTVNLEPRRLDFSTWSYQKTVLNSCQPLIIFDRFWIKAICI